jgi:hypothetical protein
MHRWSVQNLSDPEKMELNKAIDTGNPEAIKAKFKEIHTKWTEAGQNEPERQVEGRKAESATGGYTHRDEILKDMRTKEYATNEAERKRVFAKIKNSPKGIW